jgi:CheY-like chemotaxis protein
VKVLIIDDEPLIRRSLSRALIARGHEVLESGDGVHGLEQWLKEMPNLAFVDVLMPGMTGPQVVQQLPPEVRAQTKIVLMSAYTGSGGAGLKLNEEVDLFLPKPFEDIFNIVKIAEELVNHV